MIFISQWLCSSRHCSIAVAWDEACRTAEEIEIEGEKIYSSGKLNRWCGLCGGGLRIEHGRTGFKTLEEAEPVLRAFERMQLAVRAQVRN